MDYLPIFFLLMVQSKYPSRCGYHLAGTHACHDQGGFVLDTRQAPLHQSPKRAQNSRHSKKRSFCHTPYIQIVRERFQVHAFPKSSFFEMCTHCPIAIQRYFFSRDRGFHSISFHCFFSILHFFHYFPSMGNSKEK